VSVDIQPPDLQPDTSALLPEHEALITESSITPDVARARGYRSVTRQRDLVWLGFSAAGTSPGVTHPGVWAVSRHHHIRGWSRPASLRRWPDPRVRPPGRSRFGLDVPPGARASISKAQGGRLSRRARSHQRSKQLNQ